MNKKVTKLFLLLFALLVPAIGWAQEATLTANGATYQWDTDHYVLQSFDVTEYGVEPGGTFGFYVPENVVSGEDEYPVTVIAPNAFAGITQLTDITIPACVTIIGANAFKDCTGLKTFEYLGDYSEPELDETMLSGVGTADAPLMVKFEWDQRDDFYDTMTYGLQWTDGVADWKGAKITSDQCVVEWTFNQGYEKVFALNGYGPAAEGLWWRVMSVKKVTENLPTDFDGNYNLYIDEEICITNNVCPEVKAVKDDALEGIGTEAEPQIYNGNVKFLKSLGMTFSDGIGKLGGGNFQILKIVDDMGVRVNYAYNEDAEGNGEYIAISTEKSPYVDAPDLWWGENFTDYTLVLTGTINEWTSDGRVSYPVKTVKAGFAEGAKDLVKKVDFSFDQNTPVFEDGSLTGIGSAESPMIINSWQPVRLAKSLSAEAQDGVYNLGGGYFQICREEGYVYYALNGEEYIVVGYNKEGLEEDIQNGNDVAISLRTDFWENWVENGTSKSGTFYVTQVKEGAFEGLGTAEAPIECSTNPTTFQKFGGDLSTGTLASGIFKLCRTEWAGSGLNDAKYELVNGAYVLEEPIKANNGYDEYSLYLYTQFEDWDAAAQKYIITPVASIKKSALDEIRNLNITEFYMSGTNATEIEEGAFEGLGANEPLLLSLNGKTFKAMGGTFDANSIGTLAGGRFMVGMEDQTNGIKVIYAYGEDADGNSIYNVYKSEKMDYGDTYPYSLYIRDSFNEYDAEAQRYYYVKGIMSGAFGDDVKGAVKKVELDAQHMTSIDADAFSGFGTADAPLDIEGNIAMMSKMGTISDTGIISLGGGNFTYKYTSYNNGIEVKHQLTSGLTDDVAEMTVVGYEQSLGYSNPLLYISGNNSYSWTDNDNNRTWVYLRTTTIAPNAFEGIQDVTGVTIEGSYLKEIGENAFAGIGAEGANVPLSISPILINRFKDQMEGSKLAGGYFDFARIVNNNGLRYTYLYVDGAYELSKVEDLYNWDSYIAYIQTGFQDCGDESVEFTDIEGNTYWTTCPTTYVTKVKAGAFPAELAAKITGVTINDNFNNTKVEFEDGVFTGIGSAEEGASFLAKTAQTQRIIGDKVADGIYDIKGGFFAMKAITIKAQKNPNGQAFAITNAEGRDENYNYAQLINWNTELSPEMMKAPAEGDDYYTYTFLGANTITYLQIYNATEEEVDGQIRRNYYNEAYRNRQALTIDRDTTFIWSAEKGRLLLEGAPMEYDIYVGGEIVTEANAADILANDPNNAGKAKYDIETNTLTLDGINIGYSGYYTLNNEGVDGLKIVVKGDNTFSGSWPLSRFYSPTTIEGDGTLNFNYQNGANDSDCRIQINSDVTIKDITLNSTGAFYGFRGNGKLTVENAIINVEEVASEYGYAMMLGDLILNGAQILAPEGAAFTNGNNGMGVYDAEGNLAKRLYIGAPAAFTVTVDVQNLDEEKTEKATLTVENSGAVSGIALPADMAEANFSIVLPDKVTSPDGAEVAINAVAANAFAGKNLKQITLPLNNGFVHIGTGAVSATTKILAPVGCLKNYKQLASIADNVAGELLVGYLPTDENLTTVGVEVAVRVDANAKFYLASYDEVNASIVGTLYEGDVIPEMSGLLVETTDDVTGIELIVTEEYADNSIFLHNMLAPVFVDTDLSDDEGNYILVGEEFQRASTLSNPVLKAGHAFLYDPTAPAATMKLTLGGGDTPTGINGLSADDENGEWYSINGQRISKPTRKGIYIKNGKKVTLK